MKKALIPLLLVVALLLPAACTGRHSRTKEILAEAERIMNDHPDSAQMLLEQIDTAMLRRGTRDRALYALLITQAHHKNDIPIIPDSIIAEAETYFESHGDELHYMKASVYAAQRLVDLFEYPAAMPKALAAKEIAEKHDLPYWSGRAWSIIGDIYSNVLCFQAAVNAHSKAVKAYREAGHEWNWRSAWCDVAWANVLNKNYDKASSILQEMLRLCNERNWPLSYKQQVFAMLRTINMLEGNYDLAQVYQDSLDKDLTGYIPNVYYFAHKGRLLELQGKVSDGLALIDSGFKYVRSDVDSSFLYDTKGIIYRHYDMIKESHDAIFNVLAIQKRKIPLVGDRSVAAAERDYMAARAQKASEQRKQWQRTAVYIILAVLFFATAVVVILVNHNRRQRNQRVAQFLNLSRTLQDEQEKNRQLASRNETLAKQAEAFEMPPVFLNLFNQALAYFTSGTEKGRKRSMEEFNNAICEINTDRCIRFLTDSVNRSHNDIISRLKRQIPDLSDDQLKLFVLRSLGLSNRTISEITGIDVHYLYTKFRRMKEAIAASSAPDKDDFLRIFET